MRVSSAHVPRQAGATKNSGQGSALFLSPVLSGVHSPQGGHGSERGWVGEAESGWFGGMRAPCIGTDIAHGHKFRYC